MTYTVYIKATKRVYCYVTCVNFVSLKPRNNPCTYRLRGTPNRMPTIISGGRASAKLRTSYEPDSRPSSRPILLALVSSCYLLGLVAMKWQYLLVTLLLTTHQVFALAAGKRMTNKISGKSLFLFQRQAKQDIVIAT